jgi:ParB-like chromosome segregation protein Spo0J
MRMISIDDLDFSIHARAEVQTDVVDEYAARMKGNDVFPPVVVFRERRRGTLWLADGQHRVMAARQLNRAQIEADLRGGDRRDALLYACGANAAHGLRRTNADKRRAVELMLADEKWARDSNRWIAEKCAVDEKLVRRVRDKLSAAKPQMAQNERRVRRGGATHTQRLPTRQPVSSEQREVPRVQVDALTKAWDDASPEARREFVGWLREHHPEWFGPAPSQSPVAPPRRPDRSAPSPQPPA